MPENPSSGPDDADAMSALFRNLPDPARPEPASGMTPAVPGTRRAAREAAARAAAEAAEAELPSSPAAAEPVPVALEPVPVAASSAFDEVLRAEPAPAAARAASGLDEIFGSGSGSDQDHGHGKPRKKRRRGCLTAFLVVLVIVGGLTVAGVWVWDTYGDRIAEQLGWGEAKDWEPGQPGDTVLITVRQGDTGSSVSTSLFEAGVTKTDRAFYDMLVKENISVTFYPGVYELNTRLSAAEALELLSDPSRKLENSVLLREGLTMARSLEIIAEQLGFELSDMEAAVADPAVYGVDAISLEGWIFPAKYTFDPGTSAQQVIARMVERTRQSLRAAGVPDEKAHEILTIASIIQREARFEQDFFKVSRVIQNRLKPGNTETFGLLQMDSTAKYGVGELDSGSLDVSLKAQRDDNPWNTYLHPGLPIGPISNPGDLAIDAAMHPVDGPWLFFVTTDPIKGTTIFTETYRQHLVQVEVWRKWCRANPDYPC